MLNAYKGYIETKGKAAIEKIKGRKKFSTLEQVWHKPSFAGVLNDGVMLVDFDDEKEALKALELLEALEIQPHGVKTTTGIHLLFRSDLSLSKAGVILACGLKADVKTGDKCQYQVLKLDGKLRDTIGGETIPELPRVFVPLKSGTHLAGLISGDGRNEKLFSNILNLQREGFEKQEIIELYKLVNAHVLDERLSDSELESILRDEAFKPQESLRKFNLEQVGQALIRDKHVIKIFNQLFCFDGVKYVKAEREIARAIFNMGIGASQRNVTEAIFYLNNMAEDKTQAHERFISFRNGVLDLATMRLDSHSPAIVVLNHVDVNYRADAYSEIADRTLKKIACFNEDVEKALYEIIGYSLFRSSRLPVAAFLVGDGANGKSTFLKVLKTILGAENISTMDIRQLAGRFNTAELFGKLANIGDDISSETIDKNTVSMLKRVTSGNPIQGEYKGRSPFSFEPYATVICSANEVPRLKDANKALMRRILPIPFNASFSVDDEDYNPDIIAELCKEESLEHFIRFGIEALLRVLETKQFTRSQGQIEMAQEIQENSNPITAYISDKSKDDFIGNKTEDMYMDFCHWSRLEGFELEGRKKFTREACKALELKTKRSRVDGGRAYIFY